MNPDRNLLFGALALQIDVLTATQFVEACTLWANRKETALADLLLQRGWITTTDRDDIDRLVERKLRKHDGDIRAGLIEATPENVRESLSALADEDIRQSFAAFGPAPAGHVLISTSAYSPHTVDRYTLTRLHAKGGIGQVWLARDSELGRDVALKEVRPERTNPSIWTRFLKEAKVTGQLEHPGIVPVYELGKRPADEAPFYTMRFVRGRTLAEAVQTYHRNLRLGTAGPLELRQLLDDFVGVCNAVAYAHSRGVIHRDLKPQNVVLGDFGEVIVLDWGLAKLVTQPEGTDDSLPVTVEDEGSPGATVQGQVVGSPAYMSPEQAEGRLDRIEPRTDVYGLGAILYEILTGRPPFSGPQTDAVLRRVIQEPATPPQHLVPSTPRPLEAVCLHAMAKKLEARYDSAKALADDVRHWLADEPVGVLREPWTTRANRWGRRHRPIVAGAAGLLLTAVVALTVSTLLLGREQRRTAAARDDAQKNYETAETSFRQARGAVDEYYTTVSENKLLDVAGLEPLRKHLLEGALKYYQEFLRQRGDDPAVRVELGRTWYRVGRIAGEVGDQPKAIDALRQAYVIQEQLARGNPEDETHRRDLAETCRRLGDLLRWNGSLDDALSIHQQGRDLREELSRAHPEDAELQFELAMSHNGTGEVQRGSRKLADSLRSHSAAVALLDALVKQYPDRATYLWGLSRSHFHVANVRQETGEVVESLRGFQTSCDLGEKLVREHPGPPAYRIDTAWHYYELAFQNRLMHHYPAAVKAAERGRDLAGPIARASPTVTEYQNTVAANHRVLGMTYASQGRLPEALAAFDECLKVAESLARNNPTVVVYRSNLGHQLYDIGLLSLALGRTADALQHLRRARDVQEEAAVDSPRNADYRGAAAAAHVALAEVFHLTGARADLDAAVARALAIRRQLVEESPDDAVQLNALAWLLVSSPAEQYRDPNQAVAKAKRATELAPQNGNNWSTLGAAHYRARNWGKAKTAFETALGLRGGDDGYCLFFYAMTLAELGDAAGAPKRFDAAVDWQKKHQPHDPELQRIRGDAEARLRPPSPAAKP